MATIALSGVTKRFEDDAPEVLAAVNLEIADSEFMVLVGPSGCGKTTLLRIVAGLETATSGEVRVDGEDISSVRPGDRNIAMVFQNYALFPHLTVEENIGFGLKIRRTPKAERRERVVEAATLLGLHEYLDRRPGELSGGQRQRVAMGRAIVRRPAAFLMDEPLSNLDAKLRVEMRAEISRLQRRLAATTIYVTHDQTEAMTMGDRVVVLNRGVVQQVASPTDLYRYPANEFVGRFIGAPSMNLVRGSLNTGELHVAGRCVPGKIKATSPNSGDVTVGARPEDVKIGPLEGESVVLSGRVVLVENLGREAQIHLEIDEGANLSDGGTFVAVGNPTNAPSVGEMVGLGFDVDKIHLFDRESGVSLRLP